MADQTMLRNLLILTLTLTAFAVPLSSAEVAEGSESPWFGVLQPTDDRLEQVRDAGVTVATLEIGWKHYEPSQGSWNAHYLAEVRERYARLRSAGFRVILDPGLQYPPAWVFELDGATRFVNQHGDVWTGSLGEDVPNAVFNPAVRKAQAAYIARLGADLSDLELLGIRASGLLYSELRYPEPDYNGHTNSYWAFDAHAQASSPVPGWRPGDPGTTQAAEFLDWYLGSLSDYGVWLVQRYRSAFGPGPDIQVLQGSWGVRPDEVQLAVDARLDGTSRGEQRETINQGLDWARQVPRFAALDGVVVSSTWMEVEDQGSDPVYESPVRYLVRLADPHGVPVIGENSGRDGAADLWRSVERTRELGLRGMLWMREPELFAGGELATLADYAEAIGAGTPLPGRPNVTVLGGTGAISDANASDLGMSVGGTLTRVAGGDRYATAAAIVASAFPDPGGTVYIATGVNFPDALAGSAAAAADGAPVILVAPDAVPEAAAEQLRRLAPQRVVIVGGPTAVSRSVLEHVSELTSVVPTRYAGQDRFATAAAIVAAAFPDPVDTVYVATGSAFPDALAGSAAAAQAGAPILLTARDHLPGEIADQLDRLQPKAVKVLGGRGAISDATVAEIGSVTGVIPQRIAGEDRYATGAAIAADAFPAACRMFVATGETFPDALAGSAAAAMRGAPLLLVTRDTVPDAVGRVATDLVEGSC